MTGIFLAGAAGGAVGGVAWNKHYANRISAQEFVDRQLKRRIDQLGLTEAQIERIRPVMKEHEENIRGCRRKAFAEIALIFRDMNGRIEAELAPEQREKFKAIQEEERRRFESQIQGRSRRSGEGEGGKPPPPPTESPATEKKDKSHSG